MSTGTVTNRPGPPPAAARTDHPAPADRRVSPAVVLTAALLSFFVISLDGSVVNVALPAIEHTLHGSIRGLQWVVDGYTLMFAALMLSAGSLADRIGASRAYALGLAVFTAASMACGLAPGLGTLVGARMVQGCAAAVMLPASLSLIRQTFSDPAKRARAIAVWTAAGAAAVAVGPVVGGLLTSLADWRWIFFVNLPAGIVGLALLARIPRTSGRTAPLDPIGQLSVVAALAGLTYAMIEGGHRGFGSPGVLATLAVAVVALTVFLVTESRRRQPMVQLSLFRSRKAVVCLAAGFALNAVFYGVIFLFGLYFQQERGESAAATGWMFVPMCALTPVMNMLGVKVAARSGPRLPMAVGQLIMGAGAAGLIAVGAATPAAWPVLLLVPIGVGGGLAVPSLTAMILDSVPAELAGTAAAVLNTVRQVGGCLAVAGFGALVSQRSFQHGLHTSLVLGAAMLLVTAVGTTALLPRRVRS